MAKKPTIKEVAVATRKAYKLLEQLGGRYPSLGLGEAHDALHKAMTRLDFDAWMEGRITPAVFAVEDQWALTAEKDVKAVMKQLRPQYIKAKTIDANVMSTWLLPGAGRGWVESNDPFTVYVFTEDGNLRDPRQVAIEEFKRFSETHHPRPLPKEVLVELDRILAAAEREAERIG